MLALKQMPFKYINLKAVETFIGKYAPVNSFVFSKVLEEVLVGLNEGYVYWSGKGTRLKSDPLTISDALVGVSDKLLQNNLNRSGFKPWEFFHALDFDLVQTSTQDSGSSTEVKAYFHHTQFSRTEHERRVVLHIIHNTFSGTQWTISVPLQMLMLGFPSIPDAHIGYTHSICLLDAKGKPLEKEYRYIGISKRSWLERMAEHFNEIQSGSNKTFHRAWREYAGNNHVQLGSELIVVNHTFDQIMAWEEWAVDQEMAKGTSLNMIPGGFKGIKFLHEHRLLQPHEKLTLEARETAISEYQLKNPRLGIPNLLISALWKNEDYARSVICGAENRLSPDQVRDIRKLAANGLPTEKIVELVGALNVRQVERVLAGNTYSRIH